MRLTGWRLRPSLLQVSLAAFAALAAVSWWSILNRQSSAAGSLLSAQTWWYAASFLGDLLGIGSTGTPAYLDLARWRTMAGLAYQTLAMSVLATGIATIGMLLTVIPAARTSASGDLTLSHSIGARVAFLIVRIAYVGSRAVPELIWALLIIFVLSPGLLPGALALGIHNFGILGKLCAEVVEDLDPRPSRALREGGAGMGQIIFYGILPQALPQFLTYILYRWEVIIRTTIVVGFVSASGLGREFRLSLSFFHYTDVTLILITYLLLVLAVDVFSAWCRHLAQ
ncbi:MAG: ABC transporter permease subunit [Chloroflexota bacterium]|nr:ABC transporter permease subunit [Chloroflexota bacterium]